MDEEFTITSTEFPYNMAQWCVEKSSSLVRELAELADIFRTLDIADKELQERMQTLLHGALYQATKLLSFSCGSMYTPDDGTRVFKQGVEGFNAICTEYCVDTSTLYNIIRSREFISKCDLLLSGNRAPNRTYLHDLFAAPVPKSPELEEIREQLERVSMGELDWPTFVSHSRELLQQLNQHLDAEEIELKKRLRNPHFRYPQTQTPHDSEGQVS